MSVKKFGNYEENMKKQLLNVTLNKKGLQGRVFPIFCTLIKVSKRFCYCTRFCTDFHKCEISMLRQLRAQIVGKVA